MKTTILKTAFRSVVLGCATALGLTVYAGLDYTVTFEAIGDLADKITLPEPATRSCQAGATVKMYQGEITLTSGYMVDEVKFTGIDENDVAYGEDETDEYITFVMPTNDVTITFTAKKRKQVYNIDPEKAPFENGILTFPYGDIQKIELMGYDVTAGFTFNEDHTAATLNTPDVVDSANGADDAIEIGSTTVTLNVELVEGLFYGVDAKSNPSDLARPTRLTQYDETKEGHKKADILTVVRPSTEKGFFRVYVDINDQR